jgi:CO/xanthine dehydrogenase FAD-binding subunit
MVELNFDRRRPARLLDLNGVRELEECGREDGTLRIGAGVTPTRLVEELAGLLPALAIASRTVGSPQIRNRGTLAATSAPHRPPVTRCRPSWPPVRRSS